ncbi:MAG: SGNH/GDSL hydrolase family protein [Kiritimatiellae bacterium]|nr:SGNH/GDSL hydrolase family protein [Kiritimatiellia bacterium]MDD5523054.1 SGNH/GDSL hydrolase family protein [Kiritimatiellia bacterium]
MKIIRRHFVGFSVLVLLGLMLSAYGAEFILRIFCVCSFVPDCYCRVMSPGMVINYEQREYKLTLKYNRFGFRGSDLPSKKKSGEKRILFVGDSIIEGQGVSENERASDVLSEKLKSMGSSNNYTVINVGQIATNPDAYFRNLVTFGIALKPDIVVMGIFMGNDFMYGRDNRIIPGYHVAESVDLSKNSNPFALGYVRTFLKYGRRSLHRKPWRHDFWGIYFRACINEYFYIKTLGITENDFKNYTQAIDPGLLQDSLHGLINPAFLLESIRNRMGDKDSKFYNEADYEYVVSVLEESRKILADRGIKFLVLIIPDICEVYPDKFREIYTRWDYKDIPRRVRQLPVFKERMKSFCLGRGIQFIDLVQPLRSAPDCSYYLIDSHINRIGHRIVADEVCRWLIEQGCLAD